MKATPPSAELRQLTDQLLDQGALSRTEMARLEELLENEANLAYYLEVTQQEALLPIVLAETSQGAARRPVRGRAGWWLPVGMAAAAAVAFFAGVFVGGRPAGPAPVASHRSAPSAPARITGLMGVQWADGSTPDLIHGAGASEHLAIRTGLVEVTYANGVRVTLQGPASYHVTTPTSGRLEEGKLVAAVPKGAEGFKVDYVDGAVVDLGTEFAMEVKPGAPTEVGVLTGEIELHRVGEKPLALFENHAIRHDPRDREEAVRAVPMNREKYVRQLPSREFAWEVTSPGTRELEFDVSHLLWKASEYRAVFKWMSGIDTVEIRDVELRLDGRRIASDMHGGQTGSLHFVKDNLFRLDVNPRDFRSGRWSLHAKLTLAPRMGSIAGNRTPPGGMGILQLEEGLVSKATAADFIGGWSYRYLGDSFVREFHADGTVTLTRNGELFPTAFKGGRWTVEDGILRVTIPNLRTVEDHVLRDRDTLIFMGQPYENAIRVPRVEKSL